MGRFNLAALVMILAVLALGACARSSGLVPALRAAPAAPDACFELKLQQSQPLLAGGFAVYVVDGLLRDDSATRAALKLTPDENGLRITADGIPAGAASLYVRLPAGTEAAAVEVAAPDSVLTVALPGKLKRLVPIVAALIGGEGQLSFELRVRSAPLLGRAAGHPLVFVGSQRQELPAKSAAEPFPGEGNRVTDLVAEVEGTAVKLTWTEKTVGDYNNDGLVSISDVTPVAIHFLKPPDTPQREIVDGNGDGIINIADVTQIARFFGKSITGYNVYRISLPSLESVVSPDDFVGAPPLGSPLPSVRRDSFYVEGKPPLYRIVYSFDWEHPEGVYAFAVRSFSEPGDDYSETPFSNILKLELVTGNRPPVWLASAGLQSVQPDDERVTVTFGDAMDPDGDDIYYLVYYQPGSTVEVGSADAVRVDYAALPQPPPFSAVVSGLTNGVQYAFLVRVYDEHGAVESPPNDIVLTATPFVYIPSEFPWPFLHKDEPRSGRLAESLREPLSEVWQMPYRLSGTYNESSPVLDGENVYIGSVDGRVYAFDAVTGSSVFAEPAGDFISSSTAALWGEYLVIGGRGAYYILHRADGSAHGQFELESTLTVRSSPLVLDGVAYVGSEEGVVYAFNVDSGAEVWRRDINLGGFTSSPASDGRHIYLASEAGYVHKIDLKTGLEVRRSPDLGRIVYSTPVLYPAESPELLVIGADTSVIGASSFYALDLETLAVVATYSTDYGVWGSPVVVHDGTRPLVVAGQGEALSGLGKVSAHDLYSGELVWETDNIGRVFGSPAASNERIFVGSQNGNLYVIDLRGNIRQTLPLGADIYASPALVGGRVYVATSNMVLHCLEAVPDTEPPVWQGTAGVRAVCTDTGEVTVEWDWATDNSNLPVYYHIYYGTSEEFSWDSPQISDLKGLGQVTHSYRVTGLEDGTRYYFGVRASDRPLWDEPNLELNQNLLGATPPWNLLAELVLRNELPAEPSTTLTFFDAELRDGVLHFAYATQGPATQDDNLYYGTYDGAAFTSDPAILGTPGPSGLTVRSLELSFGFTGEPVISFTGTSEYGYAERTAPGVWAVTAITSIEVPTQPAVSTAYGVSARLQALFHEAVPLPPSEEVDLRGRIGDGLSWGSFEALDEDLKRGMHLRAVFLDYGDGEIPSVVYEKSSEHYPGSTIPLRGELWMAQFTEGEGWSAQVLEPAREAYTDTGKNVNLLWDGFRLHTVYYDLRYSDSPPVAVVRYATYDGSSFAAENVMSVDLPDPSAKAAHYYHNLGLALVDGEPAVASYSRRTDPVNDEQAYHLADVIYAWSSGGNWHSEKIADSVELFLHFSAPLEAVGPELSGYPLVVYPVLKGSALGANRLEIWQRGPIP